MVESSNTVIFVFWKEMSSLISLILITKSEKHDCLRYRDLQLKEKERKPSVISEIPNAKLSPCDIDDIDEQKTVHICYLFPCL